MYNSTSPLRRYDTDERNININFYRILCCLIFLLFSVLLTMGVLEYQTNKDLESLIFMVILCGTIIIISGWCCLILLFFQPS